MRTRAIVCWVVIAGGCGQAGEATHERTDTATVERPQAKEAGMLAMTPEVRPLPPEKATSAVPWTAQADDLVPPAQALIDPSGHALDAFYAKLARVDSGEAGTLARVTHLGDSTIGLDGIPHAVRRRMQARFGDGGPGYILLQRYSPNYLPKAVAHHSNGSWHDCYIAYKCLPDGHYGLGGVAFSSRGAASTKLVELVDATYGKQVTSAELWYAGQPGGGRLEVTTGALEPVMIETAAETLEDRWQHVEVPTTSASIRIRARGHGNARAYGVVLESDGPGVVWDGLSMIGAFTRRLQAWNPEHIARQIRHRDPDLVVMTYGGNDLRRVVAGGLTGEEYEREYDAVLGLVRAGKPDVPCLITSVIDHGRSGKQDVESQHVQVIVDAQRRVAATHGCAFFDTYEAMGGAGSIRRWRQRRPALAEPDLKHLNRRGRDLMGENIYRALMAGYVEYRARSPVQAAPSGPEPPEQP